MVLNITHLLKLVVVGFQAQKNAEHDMLGRQRSPPPPKQQGRITTSY